MSGAKRLFSISIDRYGHRRAALTATVICYRSRSAIREVGKVFGLTEDVTGKLADSVWGHHGDELRENQVRQGRLRSRQ